MMNIRNIFLYAALFVSFQGSFLFCGDTNGVSGLEVLCLGLNDGTDSDTCRLLCEEILKFLGGLGDHEIPEAFRIFKSKILFLCEYERDLWSRHVLDFFWGRLEGDQEIIRAQLREDVRNFVTPDAGVGTEYARPF